MGVVFLDINALFDSLAGMRDDATGKPFSPGERVELILDLMPRVFAAKLEMSVAAGDAEGVRGCEQYSKLFAQLQAMFDRAVTTGASKDEAGARVFRWFNALAEAEAGARGKGAPKAAQAL